MPRSYGTGSIEIRNGRARVRVCVEGKRKSLGTTTPDQAERTRNGWVALVASGQVETALTLKAFGREWLDQRELRGNANIGTDRSRWNRHIASAEFAGWPLADLRRRDALLWLDGLRKKHACDRRGARRISTQTIEHCLNLLRACLQSAVDREYIATNPAADITVERPKDEEVVWTYLLPEEQERLLSRVDVPGLTQLETDALIAMEEFSLGSGVRQGEQWNLHLHDFHPNAPQPHAYVQWGGARDGDKRRPKTGKGRRRVPLFGMALSAARRWLAILPRYAPENPLGLVFPTPNGARRQKSKTPKGWPELLRAAGLSNPEKRHDGHPVRWHDLRHTCASSLVAGWWGKEWTLLQVRDFLGHSSVTVTERYAHLAPGVIAEVAAATPGAPNCPRDFPTLAAECAQIPGENQARHARFEPATFGSGGRSDAESFPALSHESGNAGAIRAAAERYLRAVANRNRFAHRYGIELAELVLQATAPEVETARSA